MENVQSPAEQLYHQTVMEFMSGLPCHDPKNFSLCDKTKGFIQQRPVDMLQICTEEITPAQRIVLEPTNCVRNEIKKKKKRKKKKTYTNAHPSLFYPSRVLKNKRVQRM